MVAVLMVLTNHENLGNTGKKTGWYLPELAHPYHVFKKAGYDMTIVSPKGGKAPLVSIMPFSYFSGYLAPISGWPRGLAATLTFFRPSLFT